MDYQPQRPCPDCGKIINAAATRCGFCWNAVTPWTTEQLAAAPAPPANRMEAMRLVDNRDWAAVEQLLDERERRA